MKSKKAIIFISFLSAIILLISGYLTRKFELALIRDKTWSNDLGYKENEIHKLTFHFAGDRSVPQIPIQVNNYEFNLIFDTGCGSGLQFTNVVEDKIDYILLNQIEELNRDGSHRGWSKRIKIDEMIVFEEMYKDITTGIADWSMYSSSKFDGLIGLSYFASKVITLDYAGHRIAISSNPIDYSKLEADQYVVLPLYKSISQGQQDLLFFEAEYNNQPIMVYLDTGKNSSYFYNPDCSSSINDKPDNLIDIPLKIGDLELTLTDIAEVNDLAQAEGLPYITMVELNSDQIWKCNLLVTMDLIEQKIILKKI